MTVGKACIIKTNSVTTTELILQCHTANTLGKQSDSKYSLIRCLAVWKCIPPTIAIVVTLSKDIQSFLTLQYKASNKDTPS